LNAEAAEEKTLRNRESSPLLCESSMNSAFDS
jgi:hypothetical protein